MTTKTPSVRAEDEDDLLRETLTVKQRAAVAPDDFAWPEQRKFPITSQARLDVAARLIGRAPAAMQAAIKARAIAIAKRRGLQLPDTWQQEIAADTTKKKKGTTQESAAIVSSGTRPKKKIATIRVCYLEYNARSLNGRIYPRATCDAIHASLARKLASPQALPMTCFVSHEAANGNANTELVGRIVGGVQEGDKFYADIDLADTAVSRDQLALIAGGYMQSESMRVMGVELRHDQQYDLPLVVPQTGETPELMGIDLTTRPGLIDAARIQQVLYESQAQRESYSDAFPLPGAVQSIPTTTTEEEDEEEESVAMPTPLYLQVITEAIRPHVRMTENKHAHKRIHDHLAGVLDQTVKAVHGDESAALVAAVESQLDEAGRAIAKKHARHLARAHDESAHQLGMACESAYNKTLDLPDDGDDTGDPDDDGDIDADDPADNPDDDDAESARSVGSRRRRAAVSQKSHQGGTKTLTEQEMIAALSAKGYSGFTAPKSAEERLADMETKLAAASAQLAQLTEGHAAAAATNADPERKTAALSEQAANANANANGGKTLTAEALYAEGDYLRGTLHPRNWRALADPLVPWPDDLDPELALAELVPFLEYSMLSTAEQAKGRSLRELINAGVYA